MKTESFFHVPSISGLLYSKVLSHDWKKSATHNGNNDHSLMLQYYFPCILEFLWMHTELKLLSTSRADQMK